MSPLRQRLLDDMHLRRFSPHTQEAYLRAVVRLAKFYNRSPDQISKEEVRSFLVDLVKNKKASPSLYNQIRCALVFFCRVTLGREFALERMLCQRSAKKLPTVFTLPDDLGPIGWQNPRVTYNLLFRATAQTLLQVAADPKHLGADIGFLAVLHTWGQNLHLHPHLHCVVPGGGLAADGARWVSCRPGFFLPVRVLSRLFRGTFLASFQEAYQRQQLGFHGQLQGLAEAKAFQDLLEKLHATEWVVYAKAPFGGPEQVLKYLARYTHRVAISNHRLLKVEEDKVFFHYKDYADGHAQKIMALGAVEFIRRFLQHVVPSGFVRIRHFGFLANRCRAEKLERCRQLLASARTPPSMPAPSKEPVPDPVAEPIQQRQRCPHCGSGRMIIVERFQPNPTPAAGRAEAPRGKDTS